MHDVTDHTTNDEEDTDNDKNNNKSIALLVIRGDDRIEVCRCCWVWLEGKLVCFIVPLE